MKRLHVLMAQVLSTLCRFFGASVHRLVLVQHLRDRLHQYRGLVRVIDDAVWGNEAAKRQLSELERQIPEYYKRRPEYEYQDSI